MKWGLLQCCSKTQELPPPRQVLLLIRGLDHFCAQRQKTGLDLHHGCSCAKPETLVW